MRDGALTRRTLLAAGAGALAAEALRPAGALAGLGGRQGPRLGAVVLGSLGPGETRTVRLAAPADLLGASWSGTSHPGLQVRFAVPGGGFSPWVSAGDHGHGPEQAAAGGRRVGDPLWTGGTRLVQLRSAEGLRDLELHLVAVAAAKAAGTAAAALAQPVIAAGPGQPPIIARSVWAGGQAPPRVAPEYGAVRMAFVHHTENPNGYAASQVPAMLLAIYVFHRYVRGWDDIGYNFVVDLYGRIWEARAGGIDEAVTGAQAGGFNLVSTGVAVLGTFMSVPISSSARFALQRLLAWKLALHGVPPLGRVTVRVNPAGASYSRFPAGALVPLPRIAGHRDGDSTDCPGDVLYASLPALRGRVSRLMPNSARLTLQLTPQPPVPGAPATTAGTLGGTLASADGTPLAGATIVLQSRTVARRGEQVQEATVAEALTEASGRFGFPGQFAPARRGLALRAFYPGGIAGAGPCVSEGLVASVLTPAPVPAPTPAAPAPAPG